ncbi:MAG: peptidoglycan-binding protein [Bryobacterales bacterium]|nr:peptidoglycan-binding protein [Bryobacterales bacterium]
MHPTVRLGSRGPAVRELKQLLNRNLNPSPRLAVDEVFDQATERAVRRFQQDKWLLVDGIAGRCTWAALLGTEHWTILHRITLVPQWTRFTCWSAATAMIFGVQACMSPGSAALDPYGGIYNDSESDDPTNMRRFAQFYGLTMLPTQTWTPEGLAGLLRLRPLMINTLWRADEYVAGHGSSGHMRVVAGIRGDGTGDGTTLRIYDPWPPNRGAVYSEIYGPFIRNVPTATYQIFHR